MEEHGIVYSAMSSGLSLRPIVGSLCEWGRKQADELAALDEAPGTGLPSSS